jgi:hypothetical protein
MTRERSPRGDATARKVCVIYDPRDGRVVHTHAAITMPGGHEFSEAEVEASARDRAQRVGHDLAGLEVLSVADEECDGSSAYRVDLTEMKLSKIERQSPS